MANIARRPDGRWRARYRDGLGIEHAQHFSRKIDAQSWLDSVATAVNTGAYVDPKASRITVAEWAPRWLATKVNLKQTTRATYENLLRNHILPNWGARQLSGITHEGVASWVAGLEALGLSASTIRQTHRVLSLIFELAVKDGRLARNPATGVPLPRAARAVKVFLTHRDVDALATAAGEYRLVVLFLAYTGVRFGEMAALRVRNLDLLRRRAAITEGVAEVHGKAVFSTPKSHQSRSVPIPRFLVDDLAASVDGKSPTDFVFSAPHGGVLRIRNFRRAGFDPAVSAAGLEHLTPHALRHTAASLAIASGANVKVVQTMLGHKSATMTLDLYGHLFADQLDEVADAMDAARTAADFLRTDEAVVYHLDRKRTPKVQ
ncbi:MAG: site-specific integrase [Actinomycetota bacterium]|nr:site-specific integrase [Actinomycetota bacterium]